MLPTGSIMLYGKLGTAATKVKAMITEFLRHFEPRLIKVIGTQYFMLRKICQTWHWHHCRQKLRRDRLSVKVISSSLKHLRLTGVRFLDNQFINSGAVSN
jgi:hypothetical protein